MERPTAFFDSKAARRRRFDAPARGSALPSRRHTPSAGCIQNTHRVFSSHCLSDKRPPPPKSVLLLRYNTTPPELCSPLTAAPPPPVSGNNQVTAGGHDVIIGSRKSRKSTHPHLAAPKTRPSTALFKKMSCKTIKTTYSEPAVITAPFPSTITTRGRESLVVRLTLDSTNIVSSAAGKCLALLRTATAPNVSFSIFLPLLRVNTLQFIKVQQLPVVSFRSKLQ